MTGREFLWLRSMDRLLTDHVVGFLREQLSVWVHFLINFSHIYLCIWKYSLIWTTFAQSPLLLTCNLITISAKRSQRDFLLSDNLFVRVSIVPFIKINTQQTNPTKSYKSDQRASCKIRLLTSHGLIDKVHFIFRNQAQKTRVTLS